MQRHQRQKILMSKLKTSTFAAVRHHRTFHRFRCFTAYVYLVGTLRTFTHTLFPSDSCGLSDLSRRFFDRDGGKVVIDSVSFDLVKGATIDFKEELIRSAFVVENNPQSESACGCGSSFAAKNFAANPARD